MNPDLKLLRQIQDDAISTSVPVSELLRRCQVLATRANIPEMAEWARSELNGYPDMNSVPEYRIFDGMARGHLTGPYGSGVKNAVLPAGNLPEEFQDWGRRAYISQPIATLEEIAKGEHESVSMPWPGDLIANVQGAFYENMNLVQAWLAVSRTNFVSAVETVRNRILSFALEAERFFPPDDTGLSTGAEEKVGHVFHTHIYGSVSNLAQGSHFSQTSVVTAGDLTGLLAELRRLDIPDEDVKRLEQAIAEDGPATKNLGRRVADWIGGMTAKAISGVGKVTIETATTVVPKILARYYGLE